MFCRFTGKNMSSLLDGELKGIPKVIAESHLRVCPACRAKYAFFGSIVSASAFQPADPLPADFEDKVMARIKLAGNTEFPARAPAPKAFSLRLAAAAAGLLILLAAGFLFHAPRPAVRLPEATLSGQTGAGSEVSAGIPYSSDIIFATLANQTGR